MDPQLLSKEQAEKTLRFTLTDINVSVANALRRTMLSDIPVVVFKTTPYEENDCTIKANTSRFNNEIVKHRLSLVPIHLTDLSIPLENYLLEVKVTNNTDTIKLVTTEHFNIKDINTGNYLSKSDREAIFPKNDITGDYIEFLRLRPKLTSTIAGEEIDMTCKFSIATAKDNTAYNITSLCSYVNTIDPIKQSDAWAIKESELKESDINEKDIEFEKKNWLLLEGKRYFKENTFDYTVRSIGIFESKDIVQKACDILVDKSKKFISVLDTNGELVEIQETPNTTIPNCYNVKLIGEDYTLGKVMEYLLYALFYQKQDVLLYCGFKKLHPHDNFSIIRLGFKNASDQNVVKQLLKTVLLKSAEIFAEIKKMF